MPRPPRLGLGNYSLRQGLPSFQPIIDDRDVLDCVGRDPIPTAPTAAVNDWDDGFGTVRDRDPSPGPAFPPPSPPPPPANTNELMQRILSDGAEDLGAGGESLDEGELRWDALPPPPPLPEDTSEAIPHSQKASTMSEFEIGMAMFAEKAQLSRENWTALRSVLSTLQDIDEIQRLPQRVETLRDNFRSQLPLVPLRRKKVELDASKIAGRIDKQAWTYFFDFPQLLDRLLRTPTIVETMHFGMAELVDEATELWHAPAWGASVRTTSGEFAVYPGTDEPVLPSDTAYYRCLKSTCDCNLNLRHIGRISWTAKDKRTSSSNEQGSKVAIIQPLLTADALPERLRLALFDIVRTSLPPQVTELILIEGDDEIIPIHQLIHREVSILYDYSYTIPENATQSFIVRFVIDSTQRKGRRLNLMPPIRAELELERLGREYVIERFHKREMRSLVLSVFIDGFGVYRNMYRAILGVYLSCMSMPERQRNRRVNVLPLTLGPFAASFEDVMLTLTSLTAADSGMELEGFGFVCAPVSFYSGDMAQQQQNAGCKGPRAGRSCRICMVQGSQRGDMEFDTKAYSRTHHTTQQARQQAISHRNPAKFLNDLGLAEQRSPLESLTPMLDLTRATPGDPAHSEYQGIARLIFTLLLSTILTADAQQEYVRQLRSIPMPPGWVRLQNPSHYLGSYQMHELARISILTPVILRLWLEDKHIQPAYRDAITNLTTARRRRGEMQTGEIFDMGFTAADEITKSFACVAVSMSAILSRRKTLASVKSAVHNGRLAFIDLYQAAENAASTADAGRKAKAPKRMREISRPASVATSITMDSHISASQIAAEERDDADIEQAQNPVAALKNQERGKKAKNMHSIQERPNVHASLHFDDTAKEYGSLRTCLVLMGEDKHRKFKRLVAHANKQDVELSLLNMENVDFTIRTVLGGRFQEDQRELTDKMLRLQSECPTLFTHVLSDYDQDRLAHEGEDDCEMAALEASLISRIPSKSLSSLRLPLPATSIGNDPGFLAQLRQAYESDYAFSHPYLAGSVALKWYKKFAFTDRPTEKRICHGVGDFILLEKSHRGRMARIDGIFSHSVSSTPRVFAVVRLVSKGREGELGLDSIVRLRYHELEDVQLVVGLPAVGKKVFWMVPVSTTLGRLRRDASEDPEMLMHCDWDLTFL